MLVLACPEIAKAGPVAALSPVAAAIASQKSVLDDFGDEEEEAPLGDKEPEAEQPKPKEKEKAEAKEEEGEDEKEEEAKAPPDSPDRFAEEEEEKVEKEETEPAPPAKKVPPDEPADAPATKPVEKAPQQKPAEEEAPSERMSDPPGERPTSPLDRFGEEEEEEEGPFPGRRKPEASPEDEADEEAQEEEEPFCDVVWWERPRQKLLPLPVVPFPHYRGPSQWRTLSEVRPYVRRGEMVRKLPEDATVVKIEYYEQELAKQAAEEMGTSFEALAKPGQRFDLSDPAVAEAAERAVEILSKTIAEHDSAVQRRVRKGISWNTEIKVPLVQARLNLQLSQVRKLVREGKLQEAERMCDRLRTEVGGDDDLLGFVYRQAQEIVRVKAEKALADGDYATVRELLEGLTTRYPPSLLLRLNVPDDPIGAIRRRLAEEANQRASQAETAPPERAMELLNEASKIWPGLTRIDHMRSRISEENPILHCAYTELPNDFSIRPRSAVDRHAASLTLESLVRWVDDPKSGGHYEPQLAARLPRPLVRGRSFRLVRTNWSDSDQTELKSDSDDTELNLFFGEDVRRTLELLNEPACPGFSPAWSEMFPGVFEQDSDSFRARIVLDKDHWQPLSLMDFKVLPSDCFVGSRPKDLKEAFEEFSKHPAGTGPYRLAERDSQRVRFEANPHYRVEGAPKIREIIFHRMNGLDAVEAFLKDPQEIQLIYGVQKEHANQLLQAGKELVTLRAPTVTFLAPNYRRGRPNADLLRNENVRLAIARAIDRTEILDQYFRADGRADDHAELTGPYPKRTAAEEANKCWAYNFDVPEFDTQTADPAAAQVRKELAGKKVALSLIFPDGNRDVAAACARMAEKVKEKDFGIELKPESVDPTDFYDRVTQRHDFDLAYWSHTFEDPTYWLEPLLDGHARAREPGGLNFMGYVADADLTYLFGEIRQHKQFRTIQTLTHEVHEHVHRKAIVIPLWQLDVYVAVSGRLADVTLDPFILFGDVDQWRLRPLSSR